MSLSGFTHSAFAIRMEGQLERSPYALKHIPRGELVELLTKALLYIEVETHCKGDGLITDCKTPFSLLKKHECSLELAENGVTVEKEKTGRGLESNGILDVSLKRKADVPADGDASERRVRRSMEVDVTESNSVQEVECELEFLSSLQCSFVTIKLII